MENRFTEVMAQRTDVDLMGIVTKQRSEYNPEALLAAEFELSKRNLTVAQIEIATEINEKKQNHLNKITNEPLEMYWKILSFIFPGGAFIVTSFVVGI